MRIARALFVSSFVASLALAASCVGTTGSGLVTFRATASGPSDFDAKQTFASGLGYAVTLTRAKLHVGAVYLNRSVPTSGAQATSCTLPGIYVAEVLDGLDVDVLDPTPQAFPVNGDGTADHASAGEVWLTGGDVTADDDATVILDLAGTASKGGATFPFEGKITIGKNRAVAPADPSQPGSNPMCKQRIVTPIPIDVVPKSGGELRLEIDPRAWFDNVDFARLDKASDTPLLYRFNDAAIEQPDTNLFRALRSASAETYRFRWLP